MQRIARDIALDQRRFISNLTRSLPIIFVSPLPRRRLSRLIRENSGYLCKEMQDNKYHQEDKYHFDNASSRASIIARLNLQSVYNPNIFIFRCIQTSPLHFFYLFTFFYQLKLIYWPFFTKKWFNDIFVSSHKFLFLNTIN